MSLLATFKYCWLVLCFGHLSLRAQAWVDVTQPPFNAQTGSGAVNTTVLQAAIDSVHRAGGGTVWLPGPGVYRTSTLRLKSGVTLRINNGATLQALPNNGDYPDIPLNRRTWSDTYTQKSLLFAEDAADIRITGGGTIDGNGRGLAYLQVTKNLRPFGLRFHSCRRVLVDSVRFVTAPQWMLHFQNCDSLTIRAIDINNHGFGSNDGIDIDECRHVLIEDCNIDSNDDPIVFKSHGPNVTSDGLARRCTLATYERGVKVGNESCGGFERIAFEDIVLKQSTFGLPFNPPVAVYAAVTDGGYMDSIRFERIKVTTPYDTPFFICLNNRGNRYVDTLSPPPVQYLRNVLIRDFECTQPTALSSSIYALPGAVVENVRLENIRLTIAGGGPAVTQTPPEMPNTRPEPDMWGNVIPAWGIWARRVTGLVLDSVCMTLQAPDPRPQFVWEDTQNVTFSRICAVTAQSPTVLASPAQLQLYPVPATDQLVVELKADPTTELDVADLRLFTANGQELILPVLGATRRRMVLNVSNLPAGLYFLQSPYGIHRFAVLARP